MRKPVDVVNIVKKNLGGRTEVSCAHCIDNRHKECTGKSVKEPKLYQVNCLCKANNHQ